MKKLVTVFAALLALGSAFADGEIIAKDMLGTKARFSNWGNHKKAQFSPDGGPDGKSFVTISADDPKNAFQITRFLHSDVSRLKGRKVVLFGKVKAENVAKAPQRWFGIKFLIAYQVESKKGHTFKEGKFPRSGSFDWKEFETAVQLPEDLSMFCINIGLQETTGTIHVSDVELRFDD